MLALSARIQKCIRKCQVINSDIIGHSMLEHFRKDVFSILRAGKKAVP